MLASAAALKAQPAAPRAGQPDPVCDQALAALFTPAQSQLGTYEVCTTPTPLPDLARPGWRVEMAAPADAFGSAGRYSRLRLARLYGGRRVTVARGYIDEGDRLVSVTLISPHPDAALERLHSGTLIIRHVIRKQERPG